MVYMYTYIFPLGDFHPEQPEGSRVRLLVQFVFLLVLFVSVLVCGASCGASLTNDQELNLQNT